MRDEIFVKEEHRKPGFIHVDDYPDKIIGRRKGIIIGKYGAKLDRIQLVVGFKGRKKRTFEIDHRSREIEDYPYYWARLEWILPTQYNQQFRPFGRLRLFRGTSAESVL